MGDLTLRELNDRAAIERLMADYADRIDANDPEGAAACFARDGVGEYWGTSRGPAAIAERLRGILTAFTATSHHLSNVRIDLAGDRATGQSYVYAFHRLAGSGAWMHYWGRWVDELVREDGEWRFARREVVGVGSMNEGAPEGDLRHPGHPGRL